MTDHDPTLEDRLAAVCPACQRPIGVHTVRQMHECNAPLNYVLPHEEIPDGPIMFPGLDGFTAGEVTVMSAFVGTPMGRYPVLRFIFTGPGDEPMTRRSLPPVNLIMDADGLKTVRQLVATSTDRAILGARRGR